MRESTQTNVIERLLRVAGVGAAGTDGGATSIEIDRYRDPSRLEAEREALFRRVPIIVAHASEVSDIGAYVTEDVAGTPVFTVRGRDDEVRVFVNACRHRGARLLDAPCGDGLKAVTCPYHAWSYGLDGELLHVPGREAFGDADLASRGLREVPSAIRHGFVWAQIEGEGPLDVAAHLGPVVDDDFASFELAEHRCDRTLSRSRGANWKLVMDAFAEGYHLKSLHRTSLAAFFLEESILDDLAPHVRQVGARKTLLEVRDDREQWNLREQTTVFYNLFPNAILVFHPEWLSLITLFPEAVDRVRFTHRVVVPKRSDGDERFAQRLERSVELIDGQVFEHEDLAIAESIQRTLRAADDDMILGAQEEGMRLMHLRWDEALSAASPSAAR